MANYTTNVSDITKGQVVRAWLIGVVGTLGFHYFKVGKVKRGIIRLVLGLFLWAVVFTSIGQGVKENTSVIVTMLVILAALSLADLVRIQLGMFRDNVGAAVREP